MMEKMIDRELVSVKTYLDKFCTKFADRDFIHVVKNGEITAKTYADLYRDSLAVATAFLRRGYENKHIAVMSENRYEYPVIFFGCMLSGAVFMPVNIAEKPEQIIGMLDYSDTDIVIVSAKLAPYLPAIKQYSKRELTFISLDETEGTLPFADFLAEKTPEDMTYRGDFADERTAALCFTSGTSSGKPKCVELKAGGLFSAPRHTVQRYFGFLNDDMREDFYYKAEKGYTVYSPLPMFHLAGFIGTIVIVCIPSGSLFATSTEISAWIKDFVLTGPSLALVVPAMAEGLYSILQGTIAKMGDAESFAAYCADCDAGKYTVKEKQAYCEKYIRYVGGKLMAFAVVGAKSAGDIMKRFSYFGINTGCEYGLTETSPLVTEAGPGVPMKEGTTGLICSFNEAKLVDGVLYLKGENIMKGYYKNPEATKEIITPDGWFCTGDLAEIDDEGYLYIKGRATSVVVLSNGDNIDTDELSGIFLGSPAIREIVLLPDLKNHNDTLVALIYPAEGETQESVEKAVADVNRALPLQKRVSRFRLVEKPFEKNEMMKIKRYLYLKETV